MNPITSILNYGLLNMQTMNLISQISMPMLSRTTHITGELSQWLCHDDSTINIVVLIIIIIIIILSVNLKFVVK